MHHDQLAHCLSLLKTWQGPVVHLLRLRGIHLSATAAIQGILTNQISEIADALAQMSKRRNCDRPRELLRKQMEQMPYALIYYYWRPPPDFRHWCDFAEAREVRRVLQQQPTGQELPAHNCTECGVQMTVTPAQWVELRLNGICACDCCDPKRSVAVKRILGAKLMLFEALYLYEQELCIGPLPLDGAEPVVTNDLHDKPITISELSPDVGNKLISLVEKDTDAYA